MEGDIIARLNMIRLAKGIERVDDILFLLLVAILLLLNVIDYSKVTHKITPYHA